MGSIQGERPNSSDELIGAIVYPVVGCGALEVIGDIAHALAKVVGHHHLPAVTKAPSEGKLNSLVVSVKFVRKGGVGQLRFTPASPEFRPQGIDGVRLAGALVDHAKRAVIIKRVFLVSCVPNNNRLDEVTLLLKGCLHRDHRVATHLVLDSEMIRIHVGICHVGVGEVRTIIINGVQSTPDKVSLFTLLEFEVTIEVVPFVGLGSS